MWFKAWAFIALDKENGSEKHTRALTESVLESRAPFFNAKSEERVVLDKEGIQHKITDSSKSRDILLRVLARFQAT